MSYNYPITNDLLTMICLMKSVPRAALMQEYGMPLDDYRTLAYVEQDMANTVTKLSNELDMAKCKVSTSVTRLCDKKLVVRGEKVGSQVPLAVTRAGSIFFRECRDFLRSTFDDLFSPLDDEERSLYDMGCTATATIADGFRLSERVPDLVYIYLRSSLLTERFFTEATQQHDLSLVEFRLLFLLLQDEALTSSSVMHRLLLPKATLSDCVHRLEKRGLIGTRHIDGRSKELLLTSHGVDGANRTAHDVDRSFMQDVRSAQPFERCMYIDAASKIVERQRAQMSR